MESNAENTDVGLLDLLIVGAENLKLLTVGTVLAGLLAYGIAFQLPRTYESEAILDLSVSMPVVPSHPGGVVSPVTPAQAAAMLMSPLVLDGVIASLRQADADAAASAVMRRKLSAQIRVVAVNKDGLLRLTVKGASPQQAQSLAMALIDTWLKTTTPGERRRAELESRLIYAKESLNAIRRLRDRLAAGEGQGATGQSMRLGDVVGAFEVVSKLQVNYVNDVVLFSGALNGVAREVIKQSPTLPTEPISPRKGLVALVTALIAGFALLLGVFVRYVWARAARNPLVAAKQSRLLAALRLSR